MRPELERLRYIERHVLSIPQPPAAPAWEVQVLLDADLAADADAQRHLYAGLRLAGQQQLRQELAAIHQRLYRWGGLHRRTWVQATLARLRAAWSGRRRS